MKTKKDRRHSGYISPDAMISNKEIIAQDIVINDFYDNWEDDRDGMRDTFRDFKKIKKGICKWNPELSVKRIQMNLKQKRLLRIRKAKK